VFNCAQCNTTTQPGEGMHRLVIEDRLVDYRDADGKVVGRGFETVREVGICQACKKKNLKLD
jgi:hypothetical protein